jgi:hypothetical protein
MRRLRAVLGLITLLLIVAPPTLASSSTSNIAINEVISWAVNHDHQSIYDQQCLAFITQAYAHGNIALGTVGNGNGAAQYWAENPNNYAEHPNNLSPPAGALVFWGATPAPYANPYGHVGIYLGNNTVISSASWPESSTGTEVHEFSFTGRNSASDGVAPFTPNFYPYLGWIAPTANATATSTETQTSPGVITAMDESGGYVSGRALQIADRILSDARRHDANALNTLLVAEGGLPSALSTQKRLLAHPGVFSQIVVVLTKTHAASTDGLTWPGFTLEDGNGLFDAHDEKVLGIRSASDYTGIRVIIGGAFPSGKMGFAGIVPSNEPGPNAPASVAWEPYIGIESTIKFTEFTFGPNGTQELKNMHWSLWTASVARGTGMESIDNCSPNCGQGQYSNYAVHVTLSRPFHLSCGNIFTAASFIFTGAAPTGTPSVSGEKEEKFVTDTTNSTELCS